MNKHLLEKMQIVPAIMPVNLATAANNGDFVNMENYGRCAVVFLGAVGAASEDPTVTVLQATSDGGTTKALKFTRVDVKQGSALTGVGTFTTITQAAANTYTDDTSGEAQKLWVIDIAAEDLDIDNGYSFVQVTVAKTGTTAQVGTAIYILHDPKYASATLPSAIS
jgi:hypothetical protein